MATPFSQDLVKQAELLAHLANGKTISAACEAMGVPRRTVYAFSAEHPEFKAAMSDAKEASADILLDEARSRALDREDPKSATMLIFLIKGLRPEYKENYKPEVNVRVERSKTLDFDAGEIAEAMAILEKAKKEKAPA